MGAPAQIFSIAERGLNGAVEGSFAERMGSVGGKKLPSNQSMMSACVKGPCNATRKLSCVWKQTRHWILMA